MQEVQELNAANAVLDEYRAAYRERYKTDPILNVGMASTIVRDIIRNAGVSRAKLIVRHYLKMSGNDEYFIKRGHTLDVLQRDINLVNANLGAGSTSPSKAIIIDTLCPSCGQYFKMSGPAMEILPRTHTVLCTSCEAKA